MPRSRRAELLLLAVLCAATYLRSTSIPLIEDDYPNILASQTYGTPSGLPILFGDGIARFRATSYWIMFGVWQAAKLNQYAYHWVSILLHIANTFLVYWICLAWAPMRTAAFWSSAFFAVSEGHQEAVMWFSAINEPLMFFFGAAAFACWLEASRREWNWALQIAGVLLFGFALISKESAVIFLPLMLLVIPVSGWKSAAFRLIPYIALASVAVALVIGTRAYSFRFTDGSFSLHAPFWITWPRSFGRLLWVWGWLACGAIFLSRRTSYKRAAVLALVWIGAALIPYSFLTYMTAIPSRQVYLASAGSAMLVGLAIACWWAELSRHRAVLAAVIVAVLIYNIGYVWTRKQRQFAERARPTDELIALARRTPGPIWIRCFPRGRDVAEESVRLATGRSPLTLVWMDSGAPPAGATEFCYGKQ